MKPDRKKNGGDPALLAYGVYGAVGFQLASAVIAGLLFGGWLDKKWGTTPWLTVTGLLLGSVGGFYNLIRLLDWNQKRKERRTKET